MAEGAFFIALAIIIFALLSDGFLFGLSPSRPAVLFFAGAGSLIVGFVFFAFGLGSPVKETPSKDGYNPHEDTAEMTNRFCFASTFMSISSPDLKGN